MKIIKLFFVVLITLISASCTTTFKEKNELAIPPFLMEEYKKLRKDSK